jgi:hypothetical protein
LNSLLGFLLDGIQLHLDVISINIPILLHYQRPQFSLIGWCQLQPLEPLLGSTPQIQLGNLEELVSIQVLHFSSHGESLRPIINILMVSSPEQLIHSLGTSHFANMQQQTKIATPPTTHGP